MSNEIKGVISETATTKRIVWTINNFSSFRQTILNRFNTSPSFIFMNTSLYLRVCLQYTEYGGWLSVDLTNDDGSSCDVTFSISIQKSDGTLFGTKTVEGCISNMPSIEISFWRESNWRTQNLKLLPSDTLTIICDLKSCLKHTLPLAKEANNVKENAVLDPWEQTRLTELELLSKNLKDLLANKDCCDVLLLVQGKEFKAHKSILIARSSVFAAMFQHDTAEKQTGEIVIPDCDPDSFQEFLDYLYSGRLNDMSSNSALHLYYTSDKYNVLELKTFCTKYLMMNLTLQNICDVIILADKYDEANLLSAAQNFFNKNLEEILVTSEWETLFKKNFRLANKLLIEMSKAKK